MTSYIIEFPASLPDVQSAIQLPGAADEPAVVKLEVPAMAVNKVAELWRIGAGKLLHVVVMVVVGEDDGGEPIPVTGIQAVADDDPDYDAIAGA